MTIRNSPVGEGDHRIHSWNVGKQMCQNICQADCPSTKRSLRFDSLTVDSLFIVFTQPDKRLSFSCTCFHSSFLQSLSPISLLRALARHLYISDYVGKKSPVSESLGKHSLTNPIHFFGLMRVASSFCGSWKQCVLRVLQKDGRETIFVWEAV